MHSILSCVYFHASLHANFSSIIIFISFQFSSFIFHIESKKLSSKLFLSIFSNDILTSFVNLSILLTYCSISSLERYPFEFIIVKELLSPTSVSLVFKFKMPFSSDLKEVWIWSTFSSTSWIKDRSRLQSK